ncbi:hypothetical protein B0A49_04851 [Cryomyces minteri]|uniref:Uncharacterized protein n=1 Tax=Cryomyces minteri TaxID=331657 RepID=A0A4U0X245_9PEZI|nr:hypothetical protein B0A49_04851 [Cryomyces minteri]
MDTIKNVASAASSYVTGDKTEQSGTEPISGRTGTGTTDQPYDSGNQYDNPSMSGQSAQETRRGLGGSGLGDSGLSGQSTKATSEHRSHQHETDELYHGHTADEAGPIHPATNDHGPHSTFIGNILDPRTGPAASEKTFGDPNLFSHVPHGTQATTTSFTEGVSHSGSGVTSTTAMGASEGSMSYGGASERFAGNFGATGGLDRSSGYGNSSSTVGTAPTISALRLFFPGLPIGHSGSSLATDTAGGASGQGVNTAGVPRPEHETDKTGVIPGIHSNDPHGRDPDRPSEANEARPNYNAGGFGVVEPSVSADPRSGQKPFQKEQGGDRPMEEPSSEQTEAIRSKKDAAEDAAEGKGTGEQYVRSSGLAADGGDFDVAAPGAGKEADRLMEQKGIQKSGGGSAADTASSSSGAHEGGHKPSPLPEKILNILQHK